MQATFAQYNFADHRGVPGGGERQRAEGLHELQPDGGQPLARLQFAVHRFLRAGLVEADAQPDRDLRPALRPVPDAGGGQDVAVRVLAEFPHRQEQLRAAPGLGVGPGQGPEDGDPREFGHLLRSSADGPVSPRDLAQRQSGLLHALGDAGDELRSGVPERVHGGPGGRTGSTDITTVSPDFANLYSINANFSITPGADADHGGDARRISTRRATACRSTGISTSCRAARSWRTAARSSARRATTRASATSRRRNRSGTRRYNGLNLTLRKQLARGYRSLRDVHVVARHRRRAGAEQHRRGRHPAERSDQPAARPRRFPDRQAARLQHDRRADCRNSRATTRRPTTWRITTGFRWPSWRRAATCSTWAATAC